MFPTIFAASNADAVAAQQGLANPALIQIIMLVIMFVLFYLILILPQRKREKKIRQMLDALVVGDEVVTIGGIYGKIISIKDDTLIIETGADRTKIRIARWAVKEVLTVHE